MKNLVIQFSVMLILISIVQVAALLVGEDIPFWGNILIGFVAASFSMHVGEK